MGPHRTVLQKIYANRLTFQNRDAGEKLYESAAQVKTTTPPSYRGSTNSLTDAYLTTTERESAFITYVKVFEDQVTALKDDATVASVQTRPTVGVDSPPPLRNHRKRRHL